MATAVALDTSMVTCCPSLLPSPPCLTLPTHNVLQGTITVELYHDHAPRTCRNFATLARRGYYDGTVFHRVIADFMVQGGDPTGTGRGGASIYGTHFADEIRADLRHTGAGVLSMANAGPNTNGSQFFLTLAPTPWLDGKHTVFGRVRSGLPVLKRMGLVRTDKDSRPTEALRLIRARVLEDDDDDGGILGAGGGAPQGSIGDTSQ
ncbi:peptidyl prolyl cis-trans isomerase [Niveomyces insectorum RCEF 264]|uniref:Peptidyl-prolyl cis-trans isomerase n=1 Tax=Niveomyces insectorum RCEF 264 TaxID=1081102 RepID=A0A167VEM0_9HYPO|nr:peptidyl prolyl cis-trans isomerase [Niveomyces insectorum RCEF 264]